MKNKNKAGFTLIELLVVVLIIGVLASVAIPQYFKVVERSRLAAPNVMFSSIASAEESYQARMGNYVADFNLLDQTFSDFSGVACAAGTTCIMRNFTYTIALVGTTGFTITATRNAVGSGIPARYGTYILTHTVPGHATTCSTDPNGKCATDLL